MKKPKTMKHAMRVGDIAKLKSGGPAMTVSRAGKLDDRLTYQCVWFANGELCSAFFHSQSLVRA